MNIQLNCKAPVGFGAVDNVSNPVFDRNTGHAGFLRVRRTGSRESSFGFHDAGQCEVAVMRF